jgi:hypothetical protein
MVPYAVYVRPLQPIIQTRQNVSYCVFYHHTAQYCARRKPMISVDLRSSRAPEQSDHHAIKFIG